MASSTMDPLNMEGRTISILKEYASVESKTLAKHATYMSFIVVMRDKLLQTLVTSVNTGFSPNYKHQTFLSASSRFSSDI